MILYQSEQEVENYLDSLPRETIEELYEARHGYSTMFKNKLEQEWASRNNFYILENVTAT
jgi:hypothetical protein